MSRLMKRGSCFMSSLIFWTDKLFTSKSSAGPLSPGFFCDILTAFALKSNQIAGVSYCTHVRTLRVTKWTQPTQATEFSDM